MHSVRDIESFRADLHCHSTCSDGSNSPRELIDLALKEGLKALCITDHDTVDAYKDVLPYAKEKGLILKSGVEFSCEYKKESVHILGYDFSLDDPGLQKYCLRQQDRRRLRNREILEKLRRLRIIINEEELFLSHPEASTIGRPHIAALMVQKKYVRSIREAFQLYIGDQGCCFARGALFSVEEATSLLRAAGGKAFLAHPHLHKEDKIIKAVIEQGLDGIECYYGLSLPNQAHRWLKMAKEHRLLVSGGSDFHGSVKPHLYLGASYVEKEDFRAIFTRDIYS